MQPKWYASSGSYKLKLLMTIHHDYLIIGAGPAGLQLGYFLDCQQRDYLILERSDNPGSFFRKFPRHRQLISINKIHTGVEDPEVNLLGLELAVER